MSSATRRWSIGCVVLVWIAVAVGTPVWAQSPPAGFTAASEGFVENRGQWDPAATFRGSFGPVNVWVEKNGWTLAVEEHSGIESGPRRSNSGDPVPVVTTRGAVVRMRFLGAAAGRVVGEDRLEGRHNWFRGNDPSAWVTDVRAFGQVKLTNLYPGVSVIGREEARHFEYDVVVEPGADLAPVRIACEGQDALFIDDRGDLIVRTELGDFRQSAPIAWEETAAGGGRTPVACAWRIHEDDTCGFEVASRDRSKRLVVDPGIIWSNIFGGISDELPGLAAIAISANGNVNLAGVVLSLTFPTTVGAYQTTLAGAGTWDNFVSRYSPSGALLWSTYFGGNGFEWARGLAIGPGDTVTIVGSTSSTNFPFVAGFDASFNGSGGQGIGDAFAATFNPAASGAAQLTWSTLLGGAQDDRFNSVDVTASGLVTATGWTYSTNVPGIVPPNPYQANNQGLQDIIVARFNPALPGASQLVWFTYLGGTSYDYSGPIAVKPNGQVVIHGGAISTNFPVANAYQPMHAGGTWDTVLTVLDPALPGAAQLVYSTYLGGNQNENEGGLEVDPLGRITVGGWTDSQNFPTSVGAYDTTHNGFNDGFVTRLDPSHLPASQLVYSTYVGGASDEGINGLVLDPSAGVRAVGSVNSVNFPTTLGSFQPTFQGGGPAGYGPYDGFAFTLSPTGSALWYSSYLGGTAAYDFAYNIARDPCGAVYISGLTRSSNFPHTSGNYSFADDVFLLKMELLPAGVSRYGSSTPGCAGPLEIGVTSVPTNGSATFALTCAGAPPLSSGILAVSGGSLGSPIFLSGLAVWINPANPVLLLFTVPSDAFGSSVVTVGVPAGPGAIGQTGYAQFAWADPCAPGGISGSCALSVTVQ